MKLLSLLVLSVIMACQYSTKGSDTTSTQGNGTPSDPPTAKILVKKLRHPWEILWGPDNFIWMTERDGRISRVNPETGEVKPLLTIDEVESKGEGGLLGMVLHPQFTANPYVYVAYNYESNNGYKEKVVRFKYDGTTLVSPVILLDNVNAYSIHNGCRLLINGDKLFITTGDAANQSSAQDKGSVNGKILRINLDGSVPSDNPVPGNPMWSWGHRNAQGLVLVGSKLFISEHGPETDDEINIVEKGRNYGWPEVKGDCDNKNETTFCNASNVKEPIKTWTPTAAVCGMEYYDHDLIPGWKNSLLLAALKNSRLYVMKLNADHSAITGTTELYEGEWGRLRDVCVAPSGKVYVCTSNGSNDKIIELAR